MNPPTETPELTVIDGGAASTDRFDYRLSGVLVTPVFDKLAPNGRKVTEVTLKAPVPIWEDPIADLSWGVSLEAFLSRCREEFLEAQP
jgi:hypothetical protein